MITFPHRVKAKGNPVSIPGPGVGTVFRYVLWAYCRGNSKRLGEAVETLRKSYLFCMST